MQLLLRFLFLFTISFMYADCEEYSNEADCIASAECEWHADEMACEDAGSDDHGHECEDCMSFCVNYVMTNYGYTEEEGSAWCLSTSTNAFGCTELCSDHNDDHDDHDHDDHEVASNVIEMTGLSEGATTFTLSIIHDGHADYTSMPIYVEVHGEEDGDDHDHEDDNHGCEDCMTSCVSYVMENYGYTMEQGSAWCLSTSTNSFGCAELCSNSDHDDEEHCEDFLTEADCGMHSECEWHADEMACEDAGSDDHDDHDHEEEHCEDFLTEADCGMHSECEWHADEMACEDAGSDDHDDHDHEEHCEDFLTEADCGMHSECEWHADEMACEDAGSDDHDDHDDHDHGDCGDFDHMNVDGISLEHDGMVVYSQFQGYITGSLELHVNEPMDFTVHFLDANGDEIEFTEENPASCFPIGFEIDNPSIVSITIEENHDDDHDDDHDDHDHDEDCVNGDANMDGSVNVSDIVLLVGFIVGNNPLDSDHDCVDYIQDGNIDILDIVALVEVILGERGEVATSAEFTQRDNVLAMNANGIVGAVQITLSHGNDFEIELTSNALVSEYHTDKNTTTLIVVNPVNDIFTTNNDYVIEEIIAATTEGYIATSWAKPGAIELSNAYPNPFNPSTSFDLNVSSAGFVSLNVYNLNGQLVDVIFEGNMDAGIYNMTWNGAELSSGMYILQAVSAEKVSTQKLTLLK